MNKIIRSFESLNLSFLLSVSRTDVVVSELYIVKLKDLGRFASMGTSHHCSI